MCTTDYDEPGDARSSAGVTDLMLAPIRSLCPTNYVHAIKAAIMTSSPARRSGSFSMRHSGDTLLGDRKN